MISKFSIEDACFEDAYIKNFSMQGNDLKLDLECFADTDDPFTPDEKAESVMIPASITFKGIHNLTIDGIEASKASQLMKDGTIESFERNGHSVEVFVNWRDYDAKLSQEVMYKFDYLHFEKKMGEKFIWRWKDGE